MLCFNAISITLYLNFTYNIISTELDYINGNLLMEFYYTNRILLLLEHSTTLTEFHYINGIPLALWDSVIPLH